MSNIFGSDSGPAVPGGNLTKPLVIALLALLASRYMSGGQKSSAPAPDKQKIPGSIPGSTQDASPGSILDGLGGLIDQFQEGPGRRRRFLGQPRQEPGRRSRPGFGGARRRCGRRAVAPHRTAARSGRCGIVPYAAKCRG